VLIGKAQPTDVSLAHFGSPLSLGFGGDSAIELFSAMTVLWRFRSKSDSADVEKLPARVVGGLLFIVAAFVIVSSRLSLLGYREPQPSIAWT
jgi:hypothetical protein